MDVSVVRDDILSIDMDIEFTLSYASYMSIDLFPETGLWIGDGFIVMGELSEPCSIALGTLDWIEQWKSP